MSSVLTTGWVCIATAGSTLDGRTISADCLRQMAETYDPSFYSASLWSDGARIHPLGHVVAVKVQEEGGQLKLFATIRPTLALIDLNQSGSHGYCTIEPQENFAATGKWYLGGVSVTDKPTITGLTKMQFSAQGATRPATRSPQPEQLFSQLDGLLESVARLDRRLDSHAPLPPARQLGPDAYRLDNPTPNFLV